MLLRLSAIVTVLVFASRLWAQVPAERALATFQVNDPELEWTLWAAEPMFVNPTCIDIDHKGRVWVCESVNYRCTLRNRPLNRAAGDRILILEDSKAEGKADKVTVFYQSPELLAPLGIAIAKDPIGPGYKVYVCQSPDILLFDDKDGDGKADGPPKKLISGFRGVDHDHGVHGILIAADGKLYFSVGDQGVDGLTDKNGKVWRSNSTDCRAGTIWRCDLDGKNLELLAHNFRNPYEPCVDSFGNIFISDNDDDGNQQTRICFVMPGGNYGYHPRGPGQTHWHEEQPGVVPKALRTYFGSPTGMCFYEGTLLPKKYWGQMLHVDAGPRHVRCYTMKPNGAGYDLDRQDVVTSRDNWFRPSDVCVAPDGSVFVSDWYDPGVGGHGMGDTTRGRIYRLAPKGNKYQVPTVQLESKSELGAALLSPAISVRALAQSKLRTLNPAVLQDAMAFDIREDAPWQRARVFWMVADVFARQNNLSSVRHRLVPGIVSPGQQMWGSSFGQLAVRLLSDYDGLSRAPVIEEIIKAGSAADRREILLSAGRTEPGRAKDLMSELVTHYDGKDRFYLAALGIAVGTDPQRRDIILADFDKLFPEWNEKTANLVWELRPPSMMPRLERMIADPSLPAPQRARIADIIATNSDPAAGRRLLGVLLDERSPEARASIISNLRQFLPGKWRELTRSSELGQAIDQLIADADTAPAGIALAALSDRAEYQLKVRILAREPATPLPTRLEAISALGSMPSAESVDTLAILTAGPEPKSLGIAAVQALGRLLDGRRDSPAAAPALAALQELVIRTSAPLDVRQAALTALTGSRAGMQWVLEIQSSKSIPSELLGDAGRLARNTPYVDLRNQALIAFPPPGKLDLKALPSPAVLATRTGDPGRGKQIYAASLKNDLQCQKCHTVQGIGGSIGPDLSMIGKKGSRENLFESILQPSKAVADQYVNWQIFTTRGVGLSGLIVEETPEAVTIRDANGKDTRFDKKEIDTREKIPTSLMPDNVIGAITEDELVDLVEYLTTLQTPALTPMSWHIAGPFPLGPNGQGLDQVFGPEQKVDLKLTYAGQGGSIGWRTVAVDGQGYVDLQGFHGKGIASSVSYLTRALESPADQDARILLGTHGGAKVWVNGTLVHTSRAQRAATPGEDSVPIKLRKGRNEVLVKITSGDQPHGMYLTILSDQEIQMAK